jgi:Lrp/AsnC family leucine-responsive transcriptional regulator
MGGFNVSGGNQSDLSLDVKDRRLLYELDLDARQPVTRLAKKLEISKQAVHYRIDRLISQGIISQFVMVLDTQKLGYSFYDVFLQLQNMTTEKEQEMINYLKAMPTVGWLATAMGKWNIIVALFTKDVREFNDSLNTILNRFGRYIKDKTFIIDTDAIYCKNKYLVDEKHSFLRKDETYGDMKTASLDERDFMILKALDQNPRMSMLEIGRKTGLTFETIRYKLKLMQESGVIQGFKIKINPSAFGYEWHIMLLELNIVGKEDKEKFTKYLQNHRHVVYIINTIGNWNMMVDLHLRNYAHFQEFLSELQGKFGHMIKSHEHLTITKDCKTTFVPEDRMN